jgi:hypothetical protein
MQDSAWQIQDNARQRGKCGTVQDSTRLCKPSWDRCRTVQDSARECRKMYRIMRDSAQQSRTMQDSARLCRTSRDRWRIMQDNAGQCLKMQDNAWQIQDSASARQFRRLQRSILQCRTMQDCARQCKTLQAVVRQMQYSARQRENARQC